jgi:hypothetical protein
MSGNDSVCREFIKKSRNDGNGRCTACKEISLPLYPNLYEIETYCKTENHRKCPILKVLNLAAIV